MPGPNSLSCRASSVAGEEGQMEASPGRGCCFFSRDLFMPFLLGLLDMVIMG